MNKREFLKALEKRLKNLPKKEIQKSLAFYSEIIDDRMEEGDSEAEAVKNLGTPDEVAREILSDASFSADYTDNMLDIRINILLYQKAFLLLIVFTSSTVFFRAACTAASSFCHSK